MNTTKSENIPVKIFYPPYKLLSGILALLCLTALGFSAQAQSPHKQLNLNGVSAHWALGREYYIGALYLPENSSDPDAILAMGGLKRMEIKITNDKWSPRRFAQMWNQAILINNSQEDLNKMSDAILAFTGLPKKNLIYGDQILIDSTPGKGSKVLLNGKVMFSTKHEGFLNLLLSTWIGRRPPSSDFKTAILELQTDSETEDLISRFHVIVPEDGRTALVASWSSVSVAAVTQAKKPKSNKAPAPKQAKVASKPKPEAKKAPPKQNKTVAKTEKESSSVGSAAVVAAATVATAGAATATAASSSKAVAKPKAIPKPAPAPKATPTEAKPKAKPVAPPKQTPQKTEAKTKQTKKPPPVKAAPAKKPAMSDEEKQQARIKGIHNIYRANMLRLTYRHVVYPSKALNRDQEGTVILLVTVNRKGKVLKIDHEERSNYVSLNRAAEKAVKKATPYPIVPDQLIGDKFKFKIPIKFRIPK